MITALLLLAALVLSVIASGMAVFLFAILFRGAEEFIGVAFIVAPVAIATFLAFLVVFLMSRRRATLDKLAAVLAALIAIGGTGILVYSATFGRGSLAADAVLVLTLILSALVGIVVQWGFARGRASE